MIIFTLYNFYFELSHIHYGLNWCCCVVVRLMGSILGCGSWVSFAGPFSRDPLAWVGEVEDVIHVLVLLVGCLPGRSLVKLQLISQGLCADIVRIRLCLMCSLCELVVNCAMVTQCYSLCKVCLETWHVTSEEVTQCVWVEALFNGYIVFCLYSLDWRLFLLCAKFAC